MHLIFGAPGRYIQGPGVISQIGACIAQCGRSAVVVSDSFVIDLVRAPVATILQGGECRDHVPAVRRRGHGSRHRKAEGLVRRRTGRRRHRRRRRQGHRCRQGPRACAAARRSSRFRRSPPTMRRPRRTMSSTTIIISSCMSGISPASPRYVLVDTALIAKAPRQFLAMGIADAPDQEFRGRAMPEGGRRQHVRRPPFAGGRRAWHASAIASFAPIARRLWPWPDRASPMPPSSAWWKQPLLMSGLGFESGGLSIAHAMTRGLSRVAGPREAVHGWQVAYGLLVQLVLEQPRRGVPDRLPRLLRHGRSAEIARRLSARPTRATKPCARSPSRRLRPRTRATSSGSSASMR